MLALGVGIAAFETRFEASAGDVALGFHEDWDRLIEEWWSLYAEYESVKADGSCLGADARVSASVARMLKVPRGFDLSL